MNCLKQLVWIGSTRDDLKALPAEVQDDVGYALHQAQAGDFPDHAKPLTGFCKQRKKFIKEVKHEHITTG